MAYTDDPSLGNSPRTSVVHCLLLDVPRVYGHAPETKKYLRHNVNSFMFIFHVKQSQNRKLFFSERLVEV